MHGRSPKRVGVQTNGFGFQQTWGDFTDRTRLESEQVQESVAMALKVQREVCGVDCQLTGQHPVEDL